MKPTMIKAAKGSALLLETNNLLRLGSEHNDILLGGDDDDRIYGNGGDDIISGGAGSNILDGGEGIDTISYLSSETGVNVFLARNYTYVSKNQIDQISNFENIIGSNFADGLVGNSGDNVIRGHGGNDFIFGIAGNNTLFGGRGDDYIFSGAGKDVIHGGEGSDTVSYFYSNSGVNLDLVITSEVNGNAADDELYGIENIMGSLFDDDLTGNELDNSLFGDDGDDVIEGGAGNDLIHGGAGNDHIQGGFGADKIDGGSDFDTINYYFSPTAVKVFLASGKGYGGWAQGDTITNFERIYGSIHNDTLIGDDLSNHLYGWFGNDTISGNGGDDHLDGGGGDDILMGGSGNDIINGRDGADFIDGGADNDTVNYIDSTNEIYINLASGVASGGHAEGDVISNIENIIGAYHRNYLVGNEGDNRLEGQLSSDTLIGGLGHDELIGGEESDIFGISLNFAGTEDSHTSIKDFTSGEDKIGLIGALSFEALTFTSSHGGTIIGAVAHEGILAFVENIASNVFTSDDFTAIEII